MLRSLLVATGVARLVGAAKLKLEQKADAAVDQVKGIAIRIAVAAALAIAAVIFTLLALVAGLVLLFAWLEPEYGAIASLAIIAGSLVAIALLLVLAAALVGRGRSARKEKDQDLAEWARERETSCRSMPRATAATRSHPLPASPHPRLASCSGPTRRVRAPTCLRSCRAVTRAPRSQCSARCSRLAGSSGVRCRRRKAGISSGADAGRHL